MEALYREREDSPHELICTSPHDLYRPHFVLVVI